MPKHQLLISLALFVGGCSDPVVEPSLGLVIQAEGEGRPYFHEFGVIQDGTRPRHTFRILNTEPTPVTLHDVLPSCSCVVPVIRTISAAGEVTRGSTRGDGAVCVIPPAGILEIEVALDTSRIRRKNTDRLSTVRLRTDSAVTPFHTLELHVLVEQLVQATPWEIKLGEIPTSAGGSGHTTVIPSSFETEIDLIGAHPLTDNGLSVHLRTEEQLGRPVWVVDAVVEPGLPLGPWVGSLQIDISAPTQDPSKRHLVVPVRARVVEDVTLRPRRAFLMSTNQAGVTYTVEALIPGARVTVVSATLSECPAELFSAEATPVAPDANGRASRWKVRVLGPKARPEGEIDAKLTVKLADGSTLEAAVLAR